MPEAAEPEVVEEPDTSLALMPQSGVLVNLQSEKEVAIAYKELQALKNKVVEAERILRGAMRDRSQVLATKTFYVEGVGKVEVRGDKRIGWPDPEAVEEGLRAVGCPEDVIREIVVTETKRRVDGSRAKRAAASNPEYAKVLEELAKVDELLPTVSIT